VVGLGGHDDPDVDPAAGARISEDTMSSSGMKYAEVM
jgi:hypothetical protein